MKLMRGLVWLALVFCIGILIASLPGYWARVNALELSPEFSSIQLAAAWAGALLSVGCAALCLALGALLLVKKPGDPMAVFVALYLFMYGILLAGPEESLFEFWFPQSGSLGTALQSILFPIPTYILFLVFPNGRFVPRWSRWSIVAVVGLMLYALVAIRDTDELSRLNTTAAQLVSAAIGLLLLFALGTQVYRYRQVSNPIERQQTKWVLYSFLLSYAVLGLVSIPYYYVLNQPPGTPEPWWLPLGSLLWWLSLTIQPLAFTLAILRARLWDIDLIIHRTVSYALLTLTLAFVYFASIIVLQRLFSFATGAAQNELVTVLSTLAIAALFVPLRNRIQELIDRRFSRKRYDAQRVLEEFAIAARDETDLDKLSARLTSVVGETMQPRNMSLWLKREVSLRGSTRGH